MSPSLVEFSPLGIFLFLFRLNLRQSIKIVGVDSLVSDLHELFVIVFEEFAPEDAVILESGDALSGRQNAHQHFNHVQRLHPIRWLQDASWLSLAGFVE